MKYDWLCSVAAACKAMGMTVWAVSRSHNSTPSPTVDHFRLVSIAGTCIPFRLSLSSYTIFSDLRSWISFTITVNFLTSAHGKIT